MGRADTARSAAAPRHCPKDDAALPRGVPRHGSCRRTLHRRDTLHTLDDQLPDATAGHESAAEDKPRRVGLRYVLHEPARPQPRQRSPKQPYKGNTAAVGRGASAPVETHQGSLRLGRLHRRPPRSVPPLPRTVPAGIDSAELRDTPQAVALRHLHSRGALRGVAARERALVPRLRQQRPHRQTAAILAAQPAAQHHSHCRLVPPSACAGSHAALRPRNDGVAADLPHGVR